MTEFRVKQAIELFFLKGARQGWVDVRGGSVRGGGCGVRQTKCYKSANFK